VQVGPPPAASPVTGAPADSLPSPAPAVAEVDAGVDAGPRVFRDEDFVELDVVHRDPFRDYNQLLTQQMPVASAIPVKMRNVSLDQMRLIAVVSGVPVPYAMIVDPEGIGHVVVRGDYIGRPEVVNAGGADGLPVALNWKIDRIRPGEVVLSRADPMHPDQPPLMRSLLLRDSASDSDYTVGRVEGQLGNTGDGNAANAPDAPSPTGTFTPSPPDPNARSGSSRDREIAPAIAPAQTPTTPAPATSGGSGSRFGGVFGRRP